MVGGSLVEVSRTGGPDGAALGSPDLAARCEAWQEAGNTVVAVKRDGRLEGLVAVSDTVRLTARDAVDQLHALGLRCLMVTGDSQRTARAVGRPSVSTR